jgi:hypothetical protein
MLLLYVIVVGYCFMLLLYVTAVCYCCMLLLIQNVVLFNRQVPLLLYEFFL